MRSKFMEMCLLNAVLFPLFSTFCMQHRDSLITEKKQVELI